MAWTEASSGSAEAHLNKGSTRSVLSQSAARFWASSALRRSRGTASNKTASRPDAPPWSRTFLQALACRATADAAVGAFSQRSPALLNARRQASRLSVSSWTAFAAFAASDGDAPLCPGSNAHAATALAALAMLAAAATSAAWDASEASALSESARAWCCATVEADAVLLAAARAAQTEARSTCCRARSTACRASSASSSSSSSEVLSSFVSTRTESLRRASTRLRNRRASRGSEARNTTRGPPRCTSTTQDASAPQTLRTSSACMSSPDVCLSGPAHLTRDRSTLTETWHSRTGARVHLRTSALASNRDCWICSSKSS
mmetsp:Transcript_20851/g.58968  ORF Transcript_20851/g.58968 Transcript_20851/m.58968 type:complete len:319 (-) Transcript_20851:765-1721(-)